MSAVVNTGIKHLETFPTFLKASKTKLLSDTSYADQSSNYLKKKMIAFDDRKGGDA